MKDKIKEIKWKSKNNRTIQRIDQGLRYKQLKHNKIKVLILIHCKYTEIKF